MRRNQRETSAKVIFNNGAMSSPWGRERARSRSPGPTANRSIGKRTRQDEMGPMWKIFCLCNLERVLWTQHHDIELKAFAISVGGGTWGGYRTPASLLSNGLRKSPFPLNVFRDEAVLGGARGVAGVRKGMISFFRLARNPQFPTPPSLQRILHPLWKVILKYCVRRWEILFGGNWTCDLLPHVEGSFCLDLERGTPEIH